MIIPIVYSRKKIEEEEEEEEIQQGNHQSLLIYFRLAAFAFLAYIVVRSYVNTHE